jgi:hypothetical protein
LVDIRKVGIFFITVLAACFLYQPVNGHIHIQTVQYKPDIIYLGRDSHFELGSHPSKWDDPASQYIYAEVKDKYANITHADLNYTINIYHKPIKMTLIYGKDKYANITHADLNYTINIYHKPIKMTLFYGIPTNGTWIAKVPPSKVYIRPYSVHYVAFFKDYLNYSAMEDGPYYDNMTYTGNDENISGGKGYEVSNQSEHIPSPRLHFTFVVNDIGNRTANMLIRLAGSAPYHREHFMNFQITAGNSTDNIQVPVAYDGRLHVTNAYSPTLASSAEGGAKEFPLDHYSVNFNIKIPFKGVIPLFRITPESLYSSKWDTPLLNYTPDPQPRNNPISDDTWTVHIKFFRNDFSFWAITFPILFIFFLLGTICFLGPEEHYLVARIAITLGVFAFVFTFDTILPNVKPHYILNISTFADFLLKLVLVAAIAFTISSLIGYRIAIATKTPEAKKWIKIIHTYHIYDVLAIVFVSVMIFQECFYTNRYSLEDQYKVLYPIIIILGLGWGLLCQLILGPHQMYEDKPAPKPRTYSSPERQVLDKLEPIDVGPSKSPSKRTAININYGTSNPPERQVLDKLEPIDVSPSKSPSSRLSAICYAKDVS